MFCWRNVQDDPINTYRPFMRNFKKAFTIKMPCYNYYGHVHTVQLVQEANEAEQFLKESVVQAIQTTDNTFS